MSPAARRDLQKRREAAEAREAKLKSELDSARSEIDPLYERRASLTPQEQQALVEKIKQRTTELGKQLDVRGSVLGCRSGNHTEVEHEMHSLIALEAVAEYLGRHF